MPPDPDLRRAGRGPRAFVLVLRRSGAASSRFFKGVFWAFVSVVCLICCLLSFICLLLVPVYLFWPRHGRLSEGGKTGIGTKAAVPPEGGIQGGIRPQNRPLSWIPPFGSPFGGWRHGF